MANDVLLRETMDEILANHEAWDQGSYIIDVYRYRPARRIADCGTTQCIAGFRCLMDGLLPTRIPDLFVDPSSGVLVSPAGHAKQRFELTNTEAVALFGFMTDDPAEMKERVEEIIAGRWT